jgi:hypothetical protein
MFVSLKIKQKIIIKPNSKASFLYHYLQNNDIKNVIDAFCKPVVIKGSAKQNSVEKLLQYTKK